MNQLNGKTVLITGGNGGMGAATARRLAAIGAHVAVHYRSKPEIAHALVTEIIQAGGKAKAFNAELSDVTQVRSLFAAVDSQMGGIDIVVHTAAMGIFKPHADITDNEFETVISNNIRAGFYVLQEAARRVRNGGRIITLSVAGTVSPVAMAGLNNGSRAAIDQMILSLSKELGSKNVTANVLALGLIDTEQLLRTVPEFLRTQVISQTPLARMGHPNEVAGTIAFLVGPDGGFITGQVIRLTGGLI
ncbi:MAG: SDR family oxidoreductase [Burkholderiaceae bacterium]|nr:SDR family oxidoreductase [Burkholderiaceae bacterium]